MLPCKVRHVAILKVDVISWSCFYTVVPVTELPPSRAMTTEAIMFMTEHATDPRDSLDEPSSPQTKASPIPSQIPSRSPTETVEGNSDGFWGKCMLSASAEVICQHVFFNSTYSSWDPGSCSCDTLCCGTDNSSCSYCL